MSILGVYFLIFLLAVLAFFYLLPGRARPWVLLIASGVFYLTFDWRYSIFLLFSALTVWFAALQLPKSGPWAKKVWLVLILAANLGVLAGAKYLPWLLKRTAGLELSWLVPVGISFYTLQLAGYLIDVYRGDAEPQRRFSRFLLFAGFFPLMLQGPISRYNQLEPQLERQEPGGHIYENITFGAQLMLWGYFKKLVIADRLAIAVNAFYGDWNSFSGAAALIAVVGYSLQIYTDFSGCVDICRGVGQLFGIEIIDNFERPYSAVTIQDFWRRWHKSLSSWFRDYLYIPLGGSRRGTARKYMNLLIVFLVSGLWHGVGVHFLIWGMLHGLLQIGGAVLLPWRKKFVESLHMDWDGRLHLRIQQGVTFCLVSLVWIFFRAPGTTAAVEVCARLLTGWNQPMSLGMLGLDWKDGIVLAAALGVLLTGSKLQNRGVRVRQAIAERALPVRWSLYLLGFLAVLIFGIYGPGYSEASFIYMNF